MDIPEQPTVWSPAPSGAPPEPEKAKLFKLFAPEWAGYWFNYGGFFVATRFIIKMFCDMDHVSCPRWASFPAAIAAWFVVGGLMTAWKYRRRQL